MSKKHVKSKKHAKPKKHARPKKHGDSKELTKNEVYSLKTSRLFHGNVDEPMAIVVLFVLVGLGFFAIAIWMTFEYTPYQYPTNLVSETIAVTGIVEDGNDYHFCTDNMTYEIRINAIEDPKHLLNSADTEQTYHVLYTSSDESQFAELWQIEDEAGNCLASLEHTYTLKKRDRFLDIVIIWSVAVLYWGLSIAGYYILCNAPRYPRLAKLLIRKEYLTMEYPWPEDSHIGCNGSDSTCKKDQS